MKPQDVSAGYAESSPSRDGRVVAIESALRRYVRDENAKAVVAFIAGVPLCFLAPLILGSALWMAVLFGAGKWTPWWWWFGGVALLGIPSLFRLEMRTRGGYLDRAVAEGEPVETPMAPLLSAGSANTYAIQAIGTVLMQPTLAAAGFVEMFLAGPRLVLYGLHRRRARQREREVDLGRAAEVIAKMLSRVGGLEPVALLKSGERMPELVPVLQWMAANGWIGVTETGRSVYLFTERRKRLESAA